MARFAKHAALALAVAANAALAIGFLLTSSAAQYSTTTVIVPAKAALTDWQQGIGINFRSTSGFVTDELRQLYALGYIDAYPTSRTPVGATTSVTFGDTKVAAITRGNGDSGVDPRFAGIAIRSNSPGSAGKWRFDLEAAGSYEIRLAAGSTAGATAYQQFSIRDTDDTTVLLTCTDADGTAQDVYLDATCVERSEANWPTLNAAETVTVSAGSPPRIFLYMGATTSQSASTTLAHLFIKQL
jgi:hypothetical protein